MRYVRMLRGAPVIVPALLVTMTMAAQAQVATGHAGSGSSRSSDAQLRQRPLTAAMAEQLSHNVSDKVIIVLKNQLARIPDTPANSRRRTAAVAATQTAVLSELVATHARHVKSISLVNAVAATVSPGEAKRLAGNPAVAEITPDLPIPIASAPVARPAKAANGIKPLPGACLPKNGVQLDPEAIVNIHAAGQGKTAQNLGYTGAGVKVAWIADGLDPNNPDFIRANGKHVFVDYQDFSGTGTSAPTNGGEAYIDASSVAAQGRQVYNLQSYAGLSVPCRIRILGVAPGASLIGLNVVGSSGLAFFSVFLEAINYAVTVDHVNVLNESFGDNPFPSIATLNLVRVADDHAVKAGVTVTVASGDSGPTNTIASPAADPNVISVGATTTYRAYAQTGLFGITTPGVRGWIDNNISGLSSGGFTQTGQTVNVVAPGDLNWMLCTPNPSFFFACVNFFGKPASVELQGGTSEAAPLTAGVAALVIQAYAASHHGHRPSPDVVKKIIVSTAQDIDAPAEEQGAGLVDAYQAVLAARSYPGTTKGAQGHAVLDRATQLNAVGAVSTSEHLNETLTNDGASNVTVHLSTRTLSAPKTVASRSLTLTAPNFATETTFKVPKGQARLSVSVAVPQSEVILSLIAPNGDFAEYSMPQGGPSSYGNAQVAHPIPGKWKALVAAATFSSSTTLHASFLANTYTWHQFGTLSASSLTLARRASKSFSLKVSTPAEPGDLAGSIVVSSSAATPSFAGVTTIPVTLRSLAPTPVPTPTTFTGTLTGGLGRSAATGQTAYYEFNMPSGQQALNAEVLTGNSANTLFAELVDPSGEVVSAANNGLLATNPSGGAGLVPELGAQLHVLNPVAGRWMLIVDFYASVSGTATTQPFTVKMNVTPVTASESNLPDSTSTVLPAGTPVAAAVTVTNSGDFPEEYFVDARLAHTVTLNLTSETISTISLPNTFGPIPIYIVPSLTSSLSAKVSAPKPNFFDLAYAFGDPDLLSTTGKTSIVNFPASDIPGGEWTVAPYLVGPDGKNGVTTPVNATVSLKAVTNAFDPTVTSPTGDLWQGSTNPSIGFTPYVVEPGQSVTIPITITPEGNAGTVVSGSINLADSSFNPGEVTVDGLFGAFPTASNVAVFPYTYKIG